VWCGVVGGAQLCRWAWRLLRLWSTQSKEVGQDGECALFFRSS
jgi:hypothetical protein